MYGYQIIARQRAEEALRRARRERLAQWLLALVLVGLGAALVALLAVAA